MEDPKRASISLLRPTRERLTEIVRDIASDSSRWAIAVHYETGQDWRKLVNRRQVELCLKEGYILETHGALDTYGNWTFRMARVCAGLDVVIGVALEPKPLRPRLYVVSIKGDHIDDQ